MNELTDAQLQEARAALESRALVLDGEIRTLEIDREEALADARDRVDDAGDEAEVRRHDEVRSAEQERDAAERREIAAALTRMDAGVYGICVDCEAPIPVARIRALPTARRCAADQSRHERSAGPSN